MISSKHAILLATTVCLTVVAGCAEQASAPASDAAVPVVDAPVAGGDMPAALPYVPIAVRASGNEPSWRVDMSATEVVLTTPDGATRAGAPAIDMTYADGAVLYVATGEKGQIAVKVVDYLCVDSMSGMPHPLTVQLWLEGQELAGCGGDPASLLHGPEWTVEEMSGTPLLQDSSATLTFGSDGTLSGSSSCNRFMTGFTLTGEGLSIQQSAGSMMMCEQPLMAQEGRFLALLAVVNHFEIEPDGALQLKSADGRSIRAKR